MSRSAGCYTYERNLEICEMFRTIKRMCSDCGMSEADAMRTAYDAVSLRFGICENRILHILKDFGRFDSSDMKPRMIQDNEDLIAILTTINDDYKSGTDNSGKQEEERGVLPSL